MTQDCACVHVYFHIYSRLSATGIVEPVSYPAEPSIGGERCIDTSMGFYNHASAALASTESRHSSCIYCVANTLRQVRPKQPRSPEAQADEYTGCRADPSLDTYVVTTWKLRYEAGQIEIDHKLTPPNATMRLSSTAGIIALAFTSLASAASQWTYTDGTLSVNEKGSEAVKQK